jgi:hypothetical protein
MLDVAESRIRFVVSNEKKAISLDATTLAFPVIYHSIDLPDDDRTRVIGRPRSYVIARATWKLRPSKGRASDRRRRASLSLGPLVAAGFRRPRLASLSPVTAVACHDAPLQQPRTAGRLISPKNGVWPTASLCAWVGQTISSLPSRQHRTFECGEHELFHFRALIAFEQDFGRIERRLKTNIFLCDVLPAFSTC